MAATAEVLKCDFSLIRAFHKKHSVLIPKTSNDFSIRFDMDVSDIIRDWDEKVDKIIDCIQDKRREIFDFSKTDADSLLCYDWKVTSSRILVGTRRVGLHGIYEILDKNGQTQAIAYIALKDECVMLEGLISAPWNLRYRIDLSPLHLPERTRGAGTEAFKAALKITKDVLGKSELRTSPLDGAKSFYLGLGMIPLNDSEFHLKVD